MSERAPTVERSEAIPALVDRRLAGARAALESLHAARAQVAEVVAALSRTVRGGGLVATCGNGGSAAEALHLAEELIGRYRGNRAPHRSVCLNADPTALTCIANDFGFEQVFARQCQALLSSGDALVVFSTSGASMNLVAALRTARERGATTIGLLGRDGGACAPLCDHALIVPLADSGHVQEAHQVVMHAMCEAVE